MASDRRRLVSVGFALALGASCSRPRVNESTLKVVIVTDMAVPGSLDTLRFDAKTAHGAMLRSATLTLGSGGPSLPATFSVERDSSEPGVPVRVRAVGLSKRRPVILRQAVTVIPDEGGTLYLPLRQLCAGERSVGASSGESEVVSACGEKDTCVGGTCKSAEVRTVSGEGSTVQGAGACLDGVPCFDGLPERVPEWHGQECVIPGDFGDASRVNVALWGDSGSGWGACSPSGPCFLAMDQGDDFDEVRVEPAGIVVSPAVCEAKKKVVVSRRCPAKTRAVPQCGMGQSPEALPLPVDFARDPTVSVEPAPLPGSEPRPPLDGATPPANPPSAPQSQTVRGLLDGSGDRVFTLALRSPALEDDLVLSTAAKSYTFPRPLPWGTEFRVEVKEQPGGDNGPYVCSVENADGRVDGVANYLAGVRCVPRASHYGVKALVAGVHFSCALLEREEGTRAEGVVRCWGHNEDGPNGGSSLSTSIEGLSGVVSLFGGMSRACALMPDSTVRCWGSDRGGALGGSSILRSIPGLSGVKSIGIGTGHNCALLQGGTVRCWGGEEEGKLGGGALDRDVPGLSGVVQISLGSDHACARLGNGRLRCWGKKGDGDGNDLGRVGGAGDPTQDIPGLSGVVDVSAGLRQTCAVVEPGGRVRCWGRNNEGQSGGNGVVADLPGLSGVVKVTTGDDRTCALRADKTVTCWGFNRTRQPLGLANVKDLVAGLYHHCALLESGSVKCWGENLEGATQSRILPTRIPQLKGMVQLAPGHLHTCALSASGAVRCWGDDHFYQATEGGIERDGSNGPTFSSLTSGMFQTCGIQQTGGFRCWGEVSGARVAMEDAQPPLGQTPEPVSKLIMGPHSFCVIMSTGKLRCAPWRFEGYPMDLTDVALPSSVVDGAQTDRKTYGHFADGTVKSWNTPGPGSAPSPATMRGLGGITAWASGWDHVCTLLKEGTVQCWGPSPQNGGSDIGVNVPGLTKVTALAATALHTCVRLEGGTARCWGKNEAGETLGGNPSTDLSLPPGIKAVATGGVDSFALLEDGTVVGWGDNSAGQITGTPTLGTPFGP